ncbi:DUF3429 domain-containing protein [Pleionea sediminis]|uniref:DUF3429 domain-containing protein n=1 Tax=Pleionea sediminis TaxID=2569479 RepID=UPI001184A766|nr:DUF3429 domain-containing protein [Pleionea sediminis]
MSTTSSTAKILGWLGVLPFIISVWYTFQQSSFLGFYPPFVFLVYSGTILAFLSGALWGRIYEQENRTQRKRLLLMSNCFALLAFVGVLLSNLYIPMALAALGSGFWLIWRLEVLSFNSDWTSEWYLDLRKQLTYTVVVLHLLELVIIWL